MKKNVASQVIGAQMIDASDGSAFTGAVTVYVTGDGGTQAAGSVGSGACTHEGNGFHTYSPAQAETNYDHIGFTFVATGAIPVTVQVYTTFPQSGDGFARLGAPIGGVSIADDLDTIDDKIDAMDLELDALNGIAGVTDKLDEMLEDDGGTARFTANALEQAPSGGGGSSDWTADEKTAIKTILGIPASGTTPDVPSAGALKVIDDLIDTEVAAIKTVADAIQAKTDNLPSDPADASVIAGLIAAAEAKIDTVDTVVDAIKAKTDALPSDPADASVVAGLIATVESKVDTLDTVADAIKVTTDRLNETLEDDTAGTSRFTEAALINAPSGGGGGGDATEAKQDIIIAAIAVVDGVADAIKAKTDNLPSDPADASVVAGLIAAAEAKIDTVDTVVDAIKLKTDALPSDPADASVVAGLIAAVEAKVDTVDTVADAIKAKTDNLPSDPADASVVAGLIAAVETKVDTLDGVADAIKVTTDKLDDTLEDDAGQYRFTANALEQSPTGGGPGGNPFENNAEGSYTYGDLVRVIAGVAAGKTTIVPGVGGAATVTFRDITDSSNIVEADMVGSERQSVAVTP